MSNFRSRELLALAYQLDCTLRIGGVCEGGRGEPCHANDHRWGKGGAMKAHDFAFASGCRACHMELDQGKRLTAAQRDWIWLNGHVETMRQLWERGLIQVNNTGWREITMAQARNEFGGERKPRRKKSRCTASSKQVKRPAGGFA